MVCKNLLLLTDHESGRKEQNGLWMKVQPVYEWCSEIDEGLMESMDAARKEIKETLRIE